MPDYSTTPLPTSHPSVVAAEKRCDELYAQYTVVANTLAALYVRLGRVEPAPGSPDFPEFNRLRNEKDDLHAQRQRANDAYTRLVTGLDIR